MRHWTACLLAFAVLTGCRPPGNKPVAAATLSDQEKDVIATARRAVAQHEDWAARAEFKLQRRHSQWHVVAWRVEHPEAQGNQRYVPWGSRKIVIDDAGRVLEYKSGR